MDDEEAARWAIRLDGAPLDDAEQGALDAWLAADERRRGSLLRAEAALAYLDRGRALAEAPDPGHAPAEPIEPPEADAAYRPAFGRRGFLVGGALAGLAALGFLGFTLTRSPTLEIETAVGEVRRVPLTDGSVASVNTNSKVAVAMQGERRRVNLEDGEVWFQVAHDKARPFVVEAGEVRVQAVGTAFSVRRRQGGADVLVTEGAVEAWIVGRESRRARIAAGARSFVADTAPAIKVEQASGDVERALAWRDRRARAQRGEPRLCRGRAQPLQHAQAGDRGPRAGTRAAGGLFPHRPARELRTRRGQDARRAGRGRGGCDPAVTLAGSSLSDNAPLNGAREWV